MSALIFAVRTHRRMCSVRYHRAPDCPSGFETTKHPELRFRALVAESDTKVRFYREGLDRLGEVSA
jgi:hypothetical protein